MTHNYQPSPLTITVLDKDLYLLTLHFLTKDLDINQIERIGGGRDDYRVTEEERK